MKELKSTRFWLAVFTVFFNINCAAFAHSIMERIAFAALATLIVCIYLVSQASVEEADKLPETIDIVEACLDRAGVDLDKKEEE